MDISSISNMAVIGAGLMGHGLAQIFAVAGYNVRLLDVNQEVLDDSIEKVRANLTLMADKGVGQKEAIEPAVARIKPTTDIEAAATDAQFVIEAVVEKVDVKQKIFKELDLLCPKETILATNTSVISITEIAKQSENRGRIVGTHFWNPPYLIPLVEVITGKETDPQVMDDKIALMKHVGKHPVRVNKDVPGFVGNRLQHALWREAISIVENGIAEAETVDEVIKHGFGIRLPVLAPMENADMAGLDLTLAIHDYILKHIEDSHESSPLLQQKVKDGHLGFKTGRGFMKWDDKSIEESRMRLSEYLLDYIKRNNL